MRIAEEYMAYKPSHLVCIDFLIRYQDGAFGHVVEESDIVLVGIMHR